jgi:hypothetical protein
MKRAALGFHMHSGWGVLVAVSQDANAVTLLDRRRIVVADPEEQGAIQPYHFAAQLKPAEQEKHLAHCAASSCQLAATAISEVIRELDARRYRIVGAAILLASGRPLPPLAKILGAHPLIHTAEGEFFRQAVRQACEGLRIPVTAIRMRELDAGENKGSALQRSIAGLGRTVGPPWTKDHKTAALAAALLLAPA